MPEPMTRQDVVDQVVELIGHEDYRAEAEAEASGLPDELGPAEGHAEVLRIDYLISTRHGMIPPAPQ